MNVGHKIGYFTSWVPRYFSNYNLEVTLETYLMDVPFPIIPDANTGVELNELDSLFLARLRQICFANTQGERCL